MATNSATPDPQLSLGHWMIDGTGWSFKAVLYDTTSLQHKNIVLDCAGIALFEYTNQWNSLVLTGQLVYKDSIHELGKLFRIPHLVLQVEWAENLAEKKTKTDERGELAGDYWVEKPIRKEDRFFHQFLVNKMEMVAHDTHTDTTTYRMELVSIQWYKLSALCQYSNYNLKAPEPITDIICRILVDAVGKEHVATETFTDEPCRTDVSIYYTTTQRDNCFTAINYLLNRMYMEPSSFDIDNQPRIIIWDEKEEKYRMVKMHDDSTFLTVKHNFMQLDRFYQIAEDEVNPYSPNAGQPMSAKPTLTSFSKMSYTRFIKDYYTRHYWDVNITRDKFVRRIIMNEKVQNLFKSPNASQELDSFFYPNPNITSEKDVPDLQPFLAAKQKYLIDESKWSNTRHLYNDCIQSIANRDSFIFTRGNKVCHQPWQCFYLVRRPDTMQDKEMMDTDNMVPDAQRGENDHREIKPKTEPNKYGDNQFFGGWVTYRTTHSIVIAGSTTRGDAVPQMMERLQLVRPWEITPIPEKLRKGESNL